MAKQAVIRVVDDPALGVDAETPAGAMWFESTDAAQLELAVFFPGATYEVEGRNAGRWS